MFGLDVQAGLLFIFLVVWCVAFMVHWGGIPVAFTAFVALMMRSGCCIFRGAFRVSGALGRGPLWHSQPLYCLGSVGVGRFVAFTAFEALGVFLFCGV